MKRMFRERGVRRDRAVGWTAIVWAFSAAALLTLLTSVPAFASTQVYDRTLPLREGGTVTLQNVNGSVRIAGWDREQVEIRAVKTALHDPADLERVQIEAESDGQQVEVNTRYPQGQVVDVTVEYDVRVPERVLLAGIETVNGDVHVQGVTGAGTLDSINGSVEVIDSSGRFSGRTTNGDVRLALKELPEGEPMELATVNGSIVLSLPTGAGAELYVVSRNGDFHSDFPLRTLSTYRTNLFRGRLGSGGGEISMSTVNGAIRLVQGKPVI